MKDKLREQLIKYLQGESSRAIAAFKGSIMRSLKDRCGQIGAIATRAEAWEVLEEFEEGCESLKWLRDRITPGLSWEEGNRIWGWWDETKQLEIEVLPMTWDGTRTYKRVHLYGQEVSINTLVERGFSEAEDLMYAPGCRNGVVFVDPKRAWLFAKCGYASACELQWTRTPETGLVVERSIIEFGFWQAWTWYPNSKYWYLKNKPELFWDSDMWLATPAPEPVRHEPEGTGSEYAAVLGDANNLTPLKGVKGEGHVKKANS